MKKVLVPLLLLSPVVLITFFPIDYYHFTVISAFIAMAVSAMNNLKQESYAHSRCQSIKQEKSFAPCQ